ncbi:MAG: ATP synthase subunit I [Gammaproteobacteria bacterium]
MDTSLYRLFFYQLLLVTATSAVFLVVLGHFPAGSVWFGGLIAAINVMLLVRYARRETTSTAAAVQQTLMAFYSCAVMRFVSVAGLFILGMGILKLHPLAVLAGFIAGQMVLFFPQIRKRIAK